VNLRAASWKNFSLGLSSRLKAVTPQVLSQTDLPAILTSANFTTVTGQAFQFRGEWPTSHFRESAYDYSTNRIADCADDDGD
jgi:hypothetical protein